MKTVKNIKIGSLDKVSNEKAKELVKSGTHRYSTKSAYKHQMNRIKKSNPGKSGIFGAKIIREKQKLNK